MFLHNRMRVLRLSLTQRVLVDLFILVPGSVLLFLSLALPRLRPEFGLCGLLIFICGAASVVVGIMIDAFCIPIYGTTECQDEYNQMPIWLFYFLVFLLSVLCAFIWIELMNYISSLFEERLTQVLQVLRQDDEDDDDEDEDEDTDWASQDSQTLRAAIDAAVAREDYAEAAALKERLDQPTAMLAP